MDDYVRREEVVHRRWIRAQLTVVYIVVCTMLVILLAWTSRQDYKQDQVFTEFRSQIVANCEQNQKNTEGLNAAVNQLIVAVETSKMLTIKEKTERIAFYRQILGTVPECPPK